MTTTITALDDNTTTTPTLVLGYEAAAAPRNIVHQKIGGGVIVTLIPADLRTGTLELFYPAEADAQAALALHRRPTTFQLVDTDRPLYAMTYAVAGSGIGIRLDPDTRDLWIVSVGYQEVAP